MVKNDIPLGMPRKFVTQDSHPIYRPARLEVRLDLFGCSSVVDLYVS
jgi:hypothetical protein